MNFSRYALLCAVASFGMFTSCSDPSPAMSRGPDSTPVGRDTTLADQVFIEVNSYRASKKNKPALIRHPGLDRLAQQHSDYLARTGSSYDLYGKNVSHIGFESRALTARQSYKITSVGENVIASTDRSAKRLVQHWAASKGHEHNLSSEWVCTGIGTAITPEGQVITTQIFGNMPRTSHREMADRFNRR